MKTLLILLTFFVLFACKTKSYIVISYRLDGEFYTSMKYKGSEYYRELHFYDGNYFNVIKPGLLRQWIEVNDSIEEIKYHFYKSKNSEKTKYKSNSISLEFDKKYNTSSIYKNYFLHNESDSIMFSEHPFFGQIYYKIERDTNYLLGSSYKECKIINFCYDNRRIISGLDTTITEDDLKNFFIYDFSNKIVYESWRWDYEKKTYKGYIIDSLIVTNSSNFKNIYKNCIHNEINDTLKLNALNRVIKVVYPPLIVVE